LNEYGARGALGHFVWCSPTGSDNISPYNVMVFREVTT
jgi:hypothetical protein